MNNAIRELLIPIAPSLAWAAVCCLLTLVITHFLGKDRDRTLKRETEIRTERLQFLPLIETTMRQIAEDQPLLIWRSQKPVLVAAAARFRLLLSDRHQRRFDKAWRELEGTKDEEMLHDGKGWFVPDHDAEIIAARELLVGRLTRVYELARKP